MEALERGLACELSVVAGRGAADLAELDRVVAVVARRYRTARARYSACATEPTATTPGGPASATRAQADAERAMRTVVEEIRAIPGFEDFLRTTELRDIVKAAGGKPLVYLVNAPWGSYVLVVTGAEPAVRAVHVPEVSSVTLLHLLVIDPDEGTTGLWLAQYGTRLAWRRTFPATLERLTALEPLMRPLAALLADDPRNEAVVVPTGLLGLVPLHAEAARPRPGGRRPRHGDPHPVRGRPRRLPGARRPRRAPCRVWWPSPTPTARSPAAVANSPRSRRCSRRAVRSAVRWGRRPRWAGCSTTSPRRRTCT